MALSRIKTNSIANDAVTSTKIAPNTVVPVDLAQNVDYIINGLTVGKGTNALSANTAFGVSALAGVTTGNYATAFGWRAGLSQTTGSNEFFGAIAGQNTTTGTGSVYLGSGAGYTNIAGNYNVAVGNSALYLNAADNNTAVGYQSLYTNTTGQGNTALGRRAMYLNTTASDNTAIGNQALYYNTTGTANVAIGQNALVQNTTASNNTAVGYQAGYTNATGISFTAIGYQAGYNSTGNYNVVVGSQAGYSLTTGANNTIIGTSAGYALTTGSGNTFVGPTGALASGERMTTGSKNTIIGAFSGNNGGLDIRTASNNIVLSDGDGMPMFWIDNYRNTHLALPGSGSAPPAYSNGGDPGMTIGYMSAYPSSVARVNIQERGGSWINWSDGAGASYGIVSRNGSGVTYGSNSDYRLKENVKPLTGGLARVMALKPVSYDWIEDKSSSEGFLAHELQEVVPLAVKGQKDETYEVGNILNTDGNIISENVPTPEGELLNGEIWVKTGAKPKYQSIDQSHLIATLATAIQELNAKVDAQALEIATLKAK